METRSGKRLLDDEIIDISNENIENNADIENNENRAAKRYKTTVPRILDGKFFVIESNVNEKILARCIRPDCRKQIKGMLSSTGNFKSHYRVKHPLEMKSLDEYLRSKGEQNASVSINSQPSISQHFTSGVKPEKVKKNP